MEKFVYQYPVKQYFGKGILDEALKAELPHMGKTVMLACIDALESFIREIGMPTRWSEIGVTDEATLRKAADSTVLTAGCSRRFTHDELFEVLKETM